MNKTGPSYGPLALPEPLDEGKPLVDDGRNPHVPADPPGRPPSASGTFSLTF